MTLTNIYVLAFRSVGEWMHLLDRISHILQKGRIEQMVRVVAGIHKLSSRKVLEKQVLKNERH